MKRDNFQNTVGVMCATSFVTVLQILGRPTPLPLELNAALWCFAISIPIHAATFAGDGRWFRATFFDKDAQGRTVFLMASLVLAWAGLVLVFWSFSAWLGITFALTAITCGFAMGIEGFGPDEEPPTP